MHRQDTEVVVIGDGVIGLSTAFELARAGVACTLVGAKQAGSASGAAAGLLAPSVGHLSNVVAPFFVASLDRFPAFVQALQPFDPELRLITGLIEIASGDGGDASRGSAPDRAIPLSRDAVKQLEPSLRAPNGGLLHPRDGAVDNVRLVAALRRAIERQPTVRQFADDPVTRIDVGERRVSAWLASGTAIHAETLVLAAGAWSGLIPGLPRPLPIAPLKGQMLAVASNALQHPVMGNDIYLVPRGGEIAVGATSEQAGFDLTTSSAALEHLRNAAIELCPELSSARVVRQWAGIRPATPDMLPIIGPDPDAPRLLYACGHSRNGILLAPATAHAITQLVQGGGKTYDLAPFSIRRFQARDHGSDHGPETDNLSSGIR